ncbi:restriction endonuclease subunit S [Aeromonas veronii]|nr:restriction endonuclease subunit S [Aeromonas veronii]
MIAAEPKTTGQYQPYPEYKDSGVEWLGDIPSHWLTSKMRYMFTFGKGLTITKENLRDEGIPCINYGEVHSKYGFEVDPVKHPLRCVEEDYLKTSSSSVLNVGDFVFADTSEDIDGSGNFTQLTSDVVTFAGYHTIIVRPIDKDSHRFFAYLFDSKEFRTAIRHAVKGVKVFSITQAILRGANIWLPSQDERQGIAAFLDYETARIDRLIAQQQRLIELLKEKRQAVISHAVTKGLNPDASMKDSGIEWLGEVPAHWNRTKLKYITHQIVDAEHKTAPYFDDGEYLVCRTTNVRDGKLRLDGGKYTNSETYEEWTERGKPEVGDILFTREAPAGEACVYDGEIPLCLGQRMVLFKLDKSRFSPEFVLHSIYSGLADDFVKQLSQGSTVVHFNMADIQNIPLFEPSLDEQELLVEHLSKELAKYDNLTSSAFKAIEFMQERRTALISAAVTGKIDLRGWEPPVEEVAA